MRNEGEYDYYNILGLAPDATTDMIRKAFTNLLAGIPEAERNRTDNETYRRIVNAYEVLVDPKRRSTYDHLLLEASSSDSLEIDIQASANQIGILDTKQLVYLLVEVCPPNEEAKVQQHPLNLCLVIDRSTSMQGNRLNRVKAAVDLVVEKLAPEDLISVVSFSDRAEVVLPSGPIRNLPALLAKIRDIRASGGTEIYQGLSAGVKELRQVRLSQHTNHLILLTDGHTYGDVDDCLQLARETAVQGIGFSAFGIGAEWNDHFLDQLVAPSGGQSGFIETPEQIIEYLQERIKGLGTVYAQNLCLSLDLPDGVSLPYAFKMVPFAQPLTPVADEIKLGNIEGRAPLKFLLELSITPQSRETRLNVPLTFTANIPAQQTHEYTLKHSFELFVLSDPPQLEPPPALVKAVRTLNMYRLNERAWQEAEAGHLEMATTRMRHLSTRLLEAGETKLAQQALAETERLATMGTLSLEGRKKLKYGTRALLAQSSDLESE